MKRFFNIDDGEPADRGKDDFFGCPNERTAVRPDALRWVSGLYGLKFTFACQAL